MASLQRGEPVLYTLPEHKIKMGQFSLSADDIREALENCEGVMLHPVTLAVKENRKNSMQC